MRVGGVQARCRVVRACGRGAGGTDPPHPRADPLLRRARLRGRSLPAARARAPCSSSPAAGAPARPCSRCWRSPACCARRRGCSPGSTGCIWQTSARTRAGNSRVSHCSRCQRPSCGCSATWRSPATRCGRSRTPATPPHAPPRHRDRQRPGIHPARIGEILRPPVLAGAALGGVLSLLWLRRRAQVGAAAGVLAVFVFAAFASSGLPINTRYAFLASSNPKRVLRRGRLRLDAPRPGR